MPASVKKKTSVRYLTNSDAQMRLHGSVVMFDNIPVFIEQNSDSIKFEVTPLDGVSKVPNTVSANDERLNISSVELGYVNLTSKAVTPDAVYVQRIPARKQKQGVTADSLFFYREGGESLWMDSRGWKVPFVDLDRTIRGVYPSVQEAYEAVRSGRALGMAFSRKHAFSREESSPKLIRLRQLRETIGYVQRDKPFPTVQLVEPYTGFHNIISTLTAAGIVIEE